MSFNCTLLVTHFFVTLLNLLWCINQSIFFFTFCIVFQLFPIEKKQFINSNNKNLDYFTAFKNKIFLIYFNCNI